MSPYSFLVKCQRGGGGSYFYQRVGQGEGGWLFPDPGRALSPPPQPVDNVMYVIH